jgi:hypothetical protein
LRELYSSLVDLRERVLNSTGKDLGPVEEMNTINLSTVSTNITPSHAELNNKDQGKGASESNLKAHAYSELNNIDQDKGASGSNLKAHALSEPNNTDQDKGTSESNLNAGVITVTGKLKHS